MKKLSFLFLFGLALLLVACNSNQPKVAGKIIGLNTGTAVLEELTAEKIIPIDSSKISSYGEFSIDHNITKIGFYRISFDKNNYINLIIDSAENIAITGQKERLPLNYKVIGSKASKQLAELNQNSLKYIIKKDSIKQRYLMYRDTAGLKGNNDSIVNAVRIATSDVLTEKSEYIKVFIETYPTSLACLPAVDQLDRNKDFKYYFDVQNNLNFTYPNNDFVKDFSTRVDKMKFLAKGSIAPNISLSTPSGEIVSLTDLRGKFVLIDFWASWCPPCRRENPHLVEIYNTYKNKGFEIYGVSLDARKEPWVKAIKDDGLTWTQVSDLGYWQSSVVQQYKFESIPFSVLIDGQGRIIAKGKTAHEYEGILKHFLN